jgi:formamidopyrimidine-DNA glycosylase
VIELPESYVLASQMNASVAGKVIRRVTANAHPHAFASFNGAPELYESALKNKKVIKSKLGVGITGNSQVETLCGNMALISSTPIRYSAPGGEAPPKHQLLLEFDDLSCLYFIVQMWGSILCVPAAEANKPGVYSCLHVPSPLDDAFNLEYFSKMLKNAKHSLSAKAFLTTDNRIPGLGNGVMHDILFNARIHPKRRIDTFSQSNGDRLFYSVKSTLRYMAERGGRDTERDLYGNRGGYKTILSGKSSGMPCRNCTNRIAKEMYIGGNIYFCPECQPISE